MVLCREWGVSSPRTEEFTWQTLLTSTVKDIDARLSELKQEMERLEAARAALVGTRRGPGRPPGSGSTRTTHSHPRADRVQRPQDPPHARPPRRQHPREPGAQLVNDKPGITIPEIAKSMGIEPNYLYRVLPRLAGEGQVRKDGQGWHPARREARSLLYARE